MLPFTFAGRDRRQDPGTTWAEVAGHMAAELRPIWQEAPFAPHKGGPAYGEYLYFHPHVRDQYFDLGRGQAAIRFFKLGLPATGPATYRIVRGYGKEALELQVKGVSLRLCETGVGLLSLELHNFNYESIDDVLLINDLGRCVFPPFMSADEEDAAIAFGNAPASVEIDLGYFQVRGEFNDRHFKQPGLAVAGHITGLLSSAGFRLEGEANPKGLPFSFRPTADDRMFVVCWYGSERWSQHMKFRRPDGSYQYQDDLDWYRLIFVDGGDPLCQHEGMRRDLIDQTTYCRWADYGTLYGITRYSLICLANRSGMSLGVLREHMRGVYAQMMAMLLIQRASLLQFSDRVAKVSQVARASACSPAGKTLAMASQAENLQRDYLNFVNRLWFTEVSPQEQAIEVYSQAFNLAGLDKAMAELRTEIGELHEFVRMIHEQKESQGLKGITLLGAMFLPLSLLAALFSMNLEWFENLVPKGNWFSPWFKILAFSALAGGLYYVARRWLSSLGPDMKQVADELRLRSLRKRLRGRCGSDQDCIDEQ